jgi:tetratricopeptide (TPR) repeat protein
MMRQRDELVCRRLRGAGAVGKAVCRLLLMVTLAAGLAVPVFAQDEATKKLDDIFKRGIEALDDEEWDAAVKLFQEAIALNPGESLRRIGGRFLIRGDEYLPHVRLGQAYLGRGDCGAAFRAWEESERQGVVKKSEDGLEIIEEGHEECHDNGFLLPGEYAAQERKVAGVLREAGDIDQQIVTLNAASPTTATPEMKTVHERARSELGSARVKLDEARRTRLGQTMTDALTAAENARNGLTTARRVFERALEARGVDTKAVDTKAVDAKPIVRAAEVEAVIDGASQSAQIVQTIISTSPVPLILPADVAQTLRRAQESLDGARDKVASAKRTGADADLDEARTLAATAQTTFGRLQGDVKGLRQAAVEAELQRLTASTQQAFADTAARVKSTQAMLESRPPSAADAKQAAAQLASARGSLGRARQQFDRATAAGDLAAARTAARGVVDVNEKLDVIFTKGSQDTEIPEALTEAAKAFFAGRHEDVDRLLGVEVLQAMPRSLRVHAHTLRAAAAFARYEYSNRREDLLRQAARQDADASRRLDPAFQPNPAAFAPKFLAFFSETTTAAR